MIKLNAVKVHDGWAQYSADTVAEWVEEHELAHTTEIFIGRGSNTTPFCCSSDEVINSLIEVLGRTVDREQGLKKLTIDGFVDAQSVVEWPLRQLVPKCQHLQTLKLKDIGGNLDNRTQLLEFAAKAITNSDCLQTLQVEGMTVTPEDGDHFMKVLADSSMGEIEHLTLSQWYECFESRDECLNQLLVVLARQSKLKTVTLNDNFLSNAQLALIR